MNKSLASNDYDFLQQHKTINDTAITFCKDVK